MSVVKLYSQRVVKQIITYGLYHPDATNQIRVVTGWKVLELSNLHLHVYHEQWLVYSIPLFCGVLDLRAIVRIDSTPSSVSNTT